MTTLMRYPLLAAALALALPAMAGERCEHSRSESPILDLDGVRRVEISISLDDLILGAGTPRLDVQLCASSPEHLGKREVRVERRGDALHIGTGGTGFDIDWLSWNRYSYARIKLALPADMPVMLEVGSGDAAVADMSQLRVTLGSGDVTLRDVGSVSADVGSGDLIVEGATSASVEVGSGDILLKRVQGEVSAEVGSGDVKMEDVGPLRRLTAGSGSIEAVGVRGDAQVTSVGSGDVQLQNVRGQVRVDSVGSGDVSLRDVDGDVVVADKNTLDNVDTRRIRGRILIRG